MEDLDLKMDLSDDESKTMTDQLTEQLSKTEYRAIIEESSSQDDTHAHRQALNSE